MRPYQLPELGSIITFDFQGYKGRGVYLGHDLTAEDHEPLWGIVGFDGFTEAPVKQLAMMVPVIGMHRLVSGVAANVPPLDMILGDAVLDLLKAHRDISNLFRAVTVYWNKRELRFEFYTQQTNWDYEREFHRLMSDLSEKFDHLIHFRTFPPNLGPDYSQGKWIWKDGQPIEASDVQTDKTDQA